MAWCYRGEEEEGQVERWQQGSRVGLAFTLGGQEGRVGVSQVHGNVQFNRD